MEPFLKRTWAQIDLDALEYNYRQIRSALRPDCKLMCVVKADAYGHGAERLAQEYERLGANWFAVSNLEEGMQLRHAGICSPILILGYTPAERAGQLYEHGIAQAILSEEYARQLSEQAVRQGVTVTVHIKLDTGMSRIGLMCQSDAQSDEAVAAVRRICALPHLQPQGIFTHFAVSDEAAAGRDQTFWQYRCFNRTVELLRQRNIHFELRHCCNSGGILDYPDMNLDMVRAGIILYGLSPSEKVEHPLPLKPVMQLKSVVSLLKEVESGTAVSYGRTYFSQGHSRIATVPIGYADGYARSLSGKAEMLVRGHRAPIIGRICMDQLMLDVSQIKDIQQGDTVTVFGRDGEAFLSVDEIARLTDTINYEVVCLVSKRVPRIYLRGGRIVGEQNVICP